MPDRKRFIRGMGAQYQQEERNDGLQVRREYREEGKAEHPDEAITHLLALSKTGDQTIANPANHHMDAGTEDHLNPHPNTNLHLTALAQTGENPYYHHLHLNPIATRLGVVKTAYINPTNISC